MSFYKVGEEDAAQRYGLAPALGSGAQILSLMGQSPVGYLLGPAAVSGLSAGIEGESEEPVRRGLYAAGGNALGSIGGAAGGALLGTALGSGGAAALGAYNTPAKRKYLGLFGPKKRNPADMAANALAAALLAAPLSAGVGGVAGSLYGGNKGTRWGIKKHREAEAERGEFKREKKKKDLAVEKTSALAILSEKIAAFAQSLNMPVNLAALAKKR